MIYTTVAKRKVVKIVIRRRLGLDALLVGARRAMGPLVPESYILLTSMEYVVAWDDRPFTFE